MIEYILYENNIYEIIDTFGNSVKICVSSFDNIPDWHLIDSVKIITKEENAEYFL